MADFKCRELEIGLEFGHLSFDKRKNFSEGSSEPKKYTQVIQVRGWQPHEFLTRITSLISFAMEFLRNEMVVASTVLTAR